MRENERGDWEVTEAERELLELAIAGWNNNQLTWEKALGRVLEERLSPELRERAIVAHLARYEAERLKSDLWKELGELGFEGSNRVSPLYEQFEEEAKKRVDAK